MFLEPSSEKNTESPIRQRDDGDRMGPSEPSRPLEDTSDISLMTLFTSGQGQRTRRDNLNDERLPTAASAPRNRKMTSKGKKNPSRKVTPNTKSSGTSARGSTSNAGDFCEWLTPYWQETSKKLLSHIRTDSAGLPLISSNGYVKEETPISWSKSRSYVPQNRNSQKISWPLFTSSPASSTDREDTKTMMRSRKVRIKPTPKQAKTLRFWMKTHRQTYNEALRLVKTKKAKVNLLLKKLVVTKRDSDKGTKFETMKKSPADVRVSAVRALCHNFASAQAAYKKRLAGIKSGKIKNKRRRKQNKDTKRTRFRKKKPFEVKYKARRLTSDTFGLESKSIWMNDKALTLFGGDSSYELKMQVSESLSESKIKPDHMCKIGYCFGRWYFIIPEIIESDKTKITEPRIVGIDPGLRKAFTCVSDSGRIDEIGIDMKNDEQKLRKKSEGIMRKVKDSFGNRRKKLMRAWYRVKARAKDLVTDFHFKTIKFLMDNYDVIILGKINVQSLMSMKNQSKSNKNMFQFLSHFLFRQRLMMKMSSTSKVFVSQDESYTTQTCVNCGFLKKDVGASEVYHCSRCGLKIGRDISGASNILLRYASEFQNSLQVSGRKRRST